MNHRKFIKWGALTALLIIALPQIRAQDFRANIMKRRAVLNAGGGGGASPPGFFTVVTNKLVSGASGGVTIAANSADHVMDVVYVSWFGAQTISTAVNQTAQNGALVTNITWDATTAPASVYVWTNPPATQHTITFTWSGSVLGGADFIAVTLTNCSAGFGNIVTNHATAAQTANSNVVASASNELILGFDSWSYSATHASPVAPTLSADETFINFIQRDVSDWQDVSWYLIGKTQATNYVVYPVTETASHSDVGVCIKGF